MNVTQKSGAVVAIALGLASLSGLAHAEGGNASYHAYPPASAACPGMSWHFKSGVTEPFGYVWFRDASGVSRATGTLNASTGALHLTLVSVAGKGPAGVFDGVRAANGSVTGALKGEGCSNLTLRRRSAPSMTRATSDSRRHAEHPIPLPNSCPNVGG